MLPCLCPQPPVVLSCPLLWLCLLLSLSVSLFFPILSVSHCSFCLCPVSFIGPICLISVSNNLVPNLRLWSGRCLRVNPWTLPGAPLSKGAVNYSFKALLGETREPWDPARCQEGLAFEDSPDWTPALSICAFAQSPPLMSCPPHRTLSSLHATCLQTPVSPSLLVLCPLPRMPFPF